MCARRLTLTQFPPTIDLIRDLHRLVFCNHCALPPTPALHDARGMRNAFYGHYMLAGDDADSYGGQACPTALAMPLTLVDEVTPQDIPNNIR